MWCALEWSLGVNDCVSNTATTEAGGIKVSVGMTLTNVTISGNSAPAGKGGAIYYVGGGSSAVKNTIIASGPSGGTCKTGSTFTSLGHNLDSTNDCGLAGTGDLPTTNPYLGPLANNGGSTLTLRPGSRAINGGDNNGCPATDQRGGSRPRTTQNPCDIGAFEAGYLFLPLIIK